MIVKIIHIDFRWLRLGLHFTIQAEKVWSSSLLILVDETNNIWRTIIDPRVSITFWMSRAT